MILKLRAPKSSLLTQNYLLLSGIICKKLLHEVSPSGIPHCQFLLEHRSVRKEAGFYRKVWFQIPVIISGNKNKNISRNIALGSQIIVHGFVNYHKMRNGMNIVVLHAKKIELMDSGEK